MFEVMLLDSKVQVWARAGKEPQPDETPQQPTSCKENRQMSLPTALQILKLHLKRGSGSKGEVCPTRCTLRIVVPSSKQMPLGSFAEPWALPGLSPCPAHTTPNKNCNNNPYPAPHPLPAAGCVAWCCVCLVLMRKMPLCISAPCPCCGSGRGGAPCPCALLSGLLPASPIASAAAPSECL